MDKKALLTIIFLSIFIASCAPGERERGFGGDGDQAQNAFTGTKGVELFLEQPAIVTYPGESLTFPLRVTNQGRYDTTVTLYVSGYDQSLVQYNQKQQSVQLEGKKSAGPTDIIPGEEKIVYFETSPVEIVGTSLSQDTVVTACFPYETELTYGVCVDRNAKNGCEVTQPTNPSLAAGQAAPVAITSITSTARGPTGGNTRITYSITFTQLDNENRARIVDKEKLADACQGKKLDERIDFDVINIEEVRLGRDILLDCPAISGDRPLNLKYTSTLTCYAEIPYENTDYSSGLYIKTSYGFIKSVTQPITIEALIS